MKLLELSGIRKRFGPVEALRGVNLAVETGSVVGLVGDNGAGKSTLMKAVTGVGAADQGRVVFNGRDIAGRKPGEIRGLGVEMIYQDLALAPQQSVAANIFLGREPTKRAMGVLPGCIDDARMESEAAEMLERLGARVPSTRTAAGVLSGGQQQTVAIARALTFRPKLVIMDEPTAALAVREVDHVLDLVRRLKDEGIALILISHRLNDIFAVCDRAVALRQGRVVADLVVAETSMSEVVGHIVGSA